ncbi:TetR/AcrR family transcriptional regulator [Flavobacterium anhuiense]|uniref:TetR/AcrR family transcriptional regulator n=1 Tax=Flavobacterium anhuiense TaxID=459526 RepID=UPI00118271E3|nr:TetR/AcrR family transcriptional regulator [Flavobacterium anhuiense]
MRTKDFNEQEVVKKAIAVFWKKGYHDTSMYDLIEGLGIGRSSIYHAFGDKHNLFARAVDLYQREATARLMDAFENSPSVKDAVAAFLQSVVDDVFSDACPKGCFKINTEVEMASHDDKIRKIVYDDDLIIEDSLFRAILRGQQSGEINPLKDAKALARFICSTIAGMRVYSKFREDREFFNDIAATALSVLD